MTAATLAASGGGAATAGGVAVKTLAAKAAVVIAVGAGAVGGGADDRARPDVDSRALAHRHAGGNPDSMKRSAQVVRVAHPSTMLE